MALFTKFKTDTRIIWNAANKLGNNYKQTDFNSIYYNNETLSQPHDISAAFNEHYTNIAPKLDDNLPPSDINPLNVLPTSFPSRCIRCKYFFFKGKRS